MFGVEEVQGKTRRAILLRSINLEGWPDMIQSPYDQLENLLQVS